MKLLLDYNYTLHCTGDLLGYVGETDSRKITVEDYQTDGADLYKLRLSMPDKAEYEVDISNGEYTVPGSLLSTAGYVRLQVVAVKVKPDGVYEYVKKSNILSGIRVEESLDGTTEPIPTYEDAVEALEKVLAAVETSADNAAKAEQFAESANAAMTAAESARTAAQQAADNAATSYEGAERAAQQAVQSAQAASKSADNAKQSEQTALSVKSAIDSTAATISDMAQEVSQNAATVSQLTATAGNAKDIAVAKAEEISDSAEQIVKNAANIAELYNNKADGIVCDTEGTDIVVTDSSELPFKGMRIFGRSTQVTTTGAQLWDENAEISGFINVDDGNIKNARSPFNEVYNDYLDIEDATKLSYNVQATVGEEQLWIGIGIYDENKDFLERPAKYGIVGVNTMSGSFDVPTGAKYIRISYRKFSDGILMVNKGEIPLPHEPYTGEQPSPSPDYPQEIVSVGDSGEISLTVTGSSENVQTLTVSTPNGLPGIPVTSGGNYTDSTGQQWICDEIDFGRGVYVQRTKKVSGNDLTCSAPLIKPTGYTVYNFFTSQNPILSDVLTNDISNINYVYGTLSNIAPLEKNKTNVWNGIQSGVSSWNKDAPIILSLKIDANTDTNAAKEWWFDNRKSIYFLVLLVEPVETPLTEEQLAAYKSLHTYKPTTVITNSDNAHMAVDYTADTKAYIDNKFADVISAIISTGGNV